MDRFIPFLFSAAFHTVWRLTHVSWFKQAIPFTFLRKPSAALPPSLLLSWSLSSLDWDAQTSSSSRDICSPMLCAAGTTAALLAKQKKVHEKHAISRKMVFSLPFAPKVQTTFMAPVTALKLMENWGCSEGVRSDQMIEILPCVFNLPQPNTVSVQGWRSDPFKHNLQNI